MPLEITFTLSDRDLAHFQTIVDKAKAAMEAVTDADEIKETARQMIADVRSTDLPDFIAKRLNRLETIIDMVDDSEWRLSEQDAERVVGALVYFCNPEDLIPDHVPGLGFLDDAIYVELITRQLKAEVESYEEFCEFRKAEEARRREKGLDPHVEREAWLAEKRATLHAQMRKRRKTPSLKGWRPRW